jgi:hypothetical protein
MMPSFLTPLYEANDCHNPAGPGGGQFCAKTGAKLTTKAEAALLARIDKSPTGSVVVSHGTHYKKRFGTRERAAVDRLVKAGLIEFEFLGSGMIKTRIGDFVRGHVAEIRIRRKKS